MAFAPAASLSKVAGLLCLLTPCAAGAWRAAAGDVETSLIAELSVLVGTGQPHRLEAVLRPIFAGLPKNAHGNLEPESVPPALDRLFTQQAAWSVKGLQPGSSPQAWVPAYLQKLVADRVGERGVGLRELAALAASFEDIARKEATARLERSYRSLGLPVTGRSGRAEVLLALRVYAEDYLGNGASEGEEKTKASGTQEWLERLAGDEWKAPEAHDGKLSFQDASRAVLLIEQQLRRFKSQECSIVEPALAQCLDVSSLYSLCCRSGAEVAPGPSVWAAAWTDYPGLWIFSLACFLLSAVLNVCRWLCGNSSAEGPAESKDAAQSEEETAPTGLLGTCVALCLVCAVAVAVDLLDMTVIAPALAVGLAALAAARLAPRQHVKAKKV